MTVTKEMIEAGVAEIRKVRKTPVWDRWTDHDAIEAVIRAADIEPVGYVTASNMRALKGGLQGVMTTSAVKNAHFSEPLYAAPVADRDPVSVPDGWQLVPKEPTQEMFLSAEKAGVSFVSQQKCWGAMLAAAPQCGGSVE